MNRQVLYEQYDLLLPPKFDGGYLIIALDEKIRTGDLSNFFTPKDIDDTLREISVTWNRDSVAQWSRLKDNLLHYFIRNDAEEPGKYFLTDYAKAVLEMMRHKLDNPYKHLPLKKSFEQGFYLRFNDSSTVADLERKLGSLFIAGTKKVITDHLEGLEDELREAYKTLNTLLDNEHYEAIALVKSFAITFRKFGERAEDITNAMRSKDKFINDLQMAIDQFYGRIDQARLFADANEKNKLVDEWERARAIYEDIKDFFFTIERKINLIRRQIYRASEKLSELQEYFSSRANYRLQIQKLLNYALQTATYSEEGVIFNKGIPLKSLVYEQEKMLYLRHYAFASKKPNSIITIPPDAAYEKKERTKIEKEINRQQIINQYIDQAKSELKSGRSVLMHELMHAVFSIEQDWSIAYGVASAVIALLSESSDFVIDIKQALTPLEESQFALWEMKIHQ